MPRIVLGAPGFERGIGGLGVYENLTLPPASISTPKTASSLPYIVDPTGGQPAFPNDSIRNSLLGKCREREREREGTIICVLKLCAVYTCIKVLFIEFWLGFAIATGNFTGLEGLLVFHDIIK